MNDDNRSLEEIVEAHLRSRERLTILEAGCGSMSHFQYRPGSRLVGIDISDVQLNRNDALDEKILGDLETYGLPANAYDLIICWDVLEHLPRPTRALANFARAVNPGGLVVLASPNVLSLRGLLTKMAPHTLKVLYYKHVVGHKDAGAPGTWPFKSFHRFAIAPPAIARFARANGLEVVVSRFSTWEHPEYQSALFNTVWRPLNRIVEFLTLGAIGTDDKQGFQIILRKPLHAESRVGRGAEAVRHG